jgi:hypothetical protein
MDVSITAAFALARFPQMRRTPLQESMTEWMPSEIMAKLSVKAAATNLLAAIARSQIGRRTLSETHMGDKVIYKEMAYAKVN